MLETKVPEGQEVKIGEVIAIIDDSKQPAEQKKEVTPKKAQEEKKKEAEPKEKAAPRGVDGDRGKSASTPQATALSPAVRRIVEEEKLEAEKIHGTGAGGRVTKADVLAAVEERIKGKHVREALSFAGTAAPSSTATQPSTDGRFLRKKMSPLRRKIAQQLVMAQ